MYSMFLNFFEIVPCKQYECVWNCIRRLQYNRGDECWRRGYKVIMLRYAVGRKIRTKVRFAVFSKVH